MRAFPVPVQITDEERIIGGIITLRQLLYVVVGVALGGVALALFFLPLALRLVIFIISVSLGIMFSFVRFYNMRADRFIYLYLKWRMSNRSMYLERGN